MAKMINIADKLEAAKPKLCLSETDIYEINDDKNAVLMVSQILSKSSDDWNSISEAFTLLLGEDAVKDIESKYEGIFTRVGQIQVMLIAIMAAIQGLDYEVVEARFRKDTEEQD